MGTHLCWSALFSREVPLKDAREYAESIGAVVVETSAKNAINIEELFQGISKYLVCVCSMFASLCFWGSEDKSHRALEQSISSQSVYLMPQTLNPAALPGFLQTHPTPL